jgi:hypothetical protein
MIERGFHFVSCGKDVAFASCFVDVDYSVLERTPRTLDGMLF